MEKRMLSPKEITDAVINSGVSKVKLSTLQMILLGIMAGAFIAFGGFASTVASHSISNVGVAKVVTAVVFPVGLMLVVMCGAELFTGNSLMVTTLLDKKITFGQLMKNWVFVYIGNLIGSVIVAFLISQSGLLGMGGGAVGATTIKIASYKAGLSVSNCIASGILCNIIVCLAVWGNAAAKDVAGKVAISFFPIMAFVISGFEHSVANMYYFSMGLFAKSNEVFVQASNLSSEKLADLNLAGALGNILPVTLGNIIGGGVFVAFTYWAIFKYAPTKNSVEQLTVKTENR